MTAPRHDGRAPDQLRRVELHPGFTVLPAGSLLIRAGKTMVLCTASVTAGVPKHRETVGGWLTAEYCMLPGSTPHRTDRESAKGRVQGRTHEIQRLIGRSLRAIIDLPKLGLNTIHLDCEVMQADGGTRTASITGAWVALALAVDKLLRDGRIESSPLTGSVAAVSCGIYGGRPLLDLDYIEDSRAEVDMNLVMTSSGDMVEVQATGEGGLLKRSELDALIDLGTGGIATLRQLQLDALGDAATRLGLRP
ncbi:MAG: ribonuclease PH [Deltaproteobacteria bacterium]|nr:ribonuclease PH [Deltaproteobacteria bacterium]